MVRSRELPDVLAGRVFTRGEALAAGITASMLRGRRIESMGRNVYRYADKTGPLLGDLVEAALRCYPDAAVSHTSNLAWRGLQLGPIRPVHLATSRERQVRRAGVILHRFQGAVECEQIEGLPFVRPERTFVDCGTMLDLPELVAVGDWLVARHLTPPAALQAFAARVHYDGVQLARLAGEFVRAGSESPRESMVRFHLVSHGLPEPGMNLNLTSDSGEFLGRGDLPFLEWKVLAEYDGWHHERDADQRQRDIVRRERLESHGWLLVILTSRDLAQPNRMAWRVFNALASRGYVGRRPYVDPRFARWMRTKPSLH